MILAHLQRLYRTGVTPNLTYSHGFKRHTFVGQNVQTARENEWAWLERKVKREVPPKTCRGEEIQGNPFEKPENGSEPMTFNSLVSCAAECGTTVSLEHKG